MDLEATLTSFPEFFHDVRLLLLALPLSQLRTILLHNCVSSVIFSPSHLDLLQEVVVFFVVII